MTEPMISVIIPIYNTRAYLRKCLDSVLAQRAQSLEIILVDDGSTDGSDDICDEYAAKDARVRVIHKQNAGVAAARNAGLAAASGAWIGWVDSDDWIESDMFEGMLAGACRSGADIAVCGRVEEHRSGSVFTGWECERVLDTEQALALLLENNTMQNFLWDKLWRRELFEGLTFAEGRTFEDIAIMHRLFERAEKVICLPQASYHYVQRAGSIVDDVSLKNRINLHWAAHVRYDDMRERWPQFTDQLKGQCAVSAIGVWCCYLKNDRATRERYRAQIESIACYAREYYRLGLKHLGLGITGRMVIRLTQYPTYVSFVLASLIGDVYKLKHGRSL